MLARGGFALIVCLSLASIPAGAVAGDRTPQTLSTLAPQLSSVCPPDAAFDMVHVTSPVDALPLIQRGRISAVVLIEPGIGSALAGSLEAPALKVREVVRTLGTSDEATVFAGGRSSAAGAAMAGPKPNAARDMKW